MNKIKLQVPHVGFYLTIAAFVFTVVAFILGFVVYHIFGYAVNRWEVFCAVAALWLMGFLLVNSLFAGERPVWTAPLYAVVCVLLTFAAILFIQPCLSPIGIYFTVNNMGDVEANAAGVPRAIATTVLFVIALISMTVAAFAPMARPKKVPSNVEGKEGVS